MTTERNEKIREMRLIGLTIAIFVGCVVAPLLVYTGIELWRWALA